MDEDPLPAWGLRPVELADRHVIAPFLDSLAHPLSDYTFSQLFGWRNSLRILWTTLRGHLCVFANGCGDLTLLLPPIGDGGTDAALRDAFDLMDTYNVAHRVPERSRVEYVSDELLARLGRENLDVAPMGADYVYDTARMIDLAGGDLSSKRQAKNRFLRNYEHRVEIYDPARHHDACRALLDAWKIHQDAQHLEEPNTHAIKRQKESIAAELTLSCAADLGLRGLVVYARDPAPAATSLHPESEARNPNPDYAIRGFTFGEPLGRDQSSITIEKTDLQAKGLAQFIFSEFCRSHWSDRPLVNVGDDWGLETLAWTKNSYRPVKMLHKYVLRAARAAQVAVPPSPVAFEATGVADGGTTTVVATGVEPSRDRLPRPAAEADAWTLFPVEEPVAASDDPEVPAVRPARKADLAAAALLEQSCFDQFCLSKRQLQYLHGRGSAVFLVADHGDAVVGQGIALVRQHRGGASGRIYSLAVRPDFRGRRLGARLLRGMVDALAERGARRIYLEVEQANEPAIRLYERHGFRTIGTLDDYYGPGRAGLHMMYESPASADSLPAPVAAA